MQKVFALPELQLKFQRRPVRPPDEFAEFSPIVLGNRYKRSLKEFYAKRREVDLVFSTK
jgi:hypothetical protein